jgi:hypothetical protein
MCSEFWKAVSLKAGMNWKDNHVVREKGSLGLAEGSFHWRTLVMSVFKLSGS